MITILFLNEKDMLNLISFDEVMDTIEEAYQIYEENNFEMPDRIHLDYKNNTLLYMPCFLNDIFGTKILTLCPENRAKKKPVIDGLMLLNDDETGEPLALMDGKILTAVRTGAVGGVGIRHLSPETSKTVGLIGAGVQGVYQLLYACQARSIEEIYIFDIFRDSLPVFKKLLEAKLPNVKINIADSVESLLKSSEIIITATPSNQPVLPNDPSLLEGKHFIGIGSYKPNMREYPDALLSLVDKVYIDTDFAKEESGDLITPLNEKLLKEEQIETFGHFLLHEKNKETIANQTTFFKSVGMALFDLTVARLIYLKALEKNVGQKLDF